jgi:hypothetical protein
LYSVLCSWLIIHTKAHLLNCAEILALSWNGKVGWYFCCAPQLAYVARLTLCLCELFWFSQPISHVWLINCNVDIRWQIVFCDRFRS